MNAVKTILLESGTVGTSYGSAIEGEETTVYLNDEKGNRISETGVIEEVLLIVWDYDK